jgi:hypothetical protein
MEADAGEPHCLRERFAARVPAEVMWDPFGIPDSFRARFLTGLPTFINTSATPKRLHPGQDPTTDLVEAQASEPLMTGEVPLRTLILMLGGRSGAARTVDRW